jgi:hypothetical protein
MAPARAAAALPNGQGAAVPNEPVTSAGAVTSAAEAGAAGASAAAPAEAEG